MLRTLVRRSAAAATERPPLTIYTNPYQTKKIWPPDYKQLSWQDQLKFEKKYKRRVILASRRPKWDKGVKLAQLATTVGVLSWLFFFAELEFHGKRYVPNEEIKKGVGTLWGIFDESNRYGDPNAANIPQLVNDRSDRPR
ncbi:unnamed protein product [Parascedosporium putredinis]|uniref:Uncharacterized protein n=1 Tax=Parascedosporium putredinis TaxID=1442378 RepID=A0A9P1MBE9_9PEZI|nr:unnamed protein product [Parascedosporium putredinis]CAI7999429.1 unnamed protein product [Parascedosporium putredinis]